ncbi:hypothetical protein DPMN_065570 [Dreissena polymorpha]|uniref:Uncharacterized protein n=1 Tax=Dreissena polymorpha TaxID=45954 RepID=A0A9D4BS64_DREPO|nr:hypothetical protein DPMN_065570 [Dreissena polymorpha]
MVLDSTAIVHPTSVLSCIQTLVKGKASGPDRIMYEHVLFGAVTLAELLSHMYTQMLQSGHIPDKMKEGEIITLHKGGNIRKHDYATWTLDKLSTEFVTRTYSTNC